MKKSWLIFLMLVLLFSSCGTQKEDASGKDVLSVSILPQKYILEQIVGDQFEINVMVPPGANPVTYEPSPKQMKKLNESKAYIKVGYLVFEKVWIPKIKSASPELKIIDQSANVNLISDEHTHHHAPSQKEKVNADPHIWTSPKSVKKQVEVIFQNLSNLDPDNTVLYRKNFLRFNKKLDSLDLYMNDKFDGLNNRHFLIFHPALSYLARDYRLHQIPIEIEGKEPSPAVLKNIIDTAEKYNLKTIFIQEQFNTDNAQTIARELNGQLVKINPLDYNWYDEMIEITNKLVAAMQQ